MSPPFREVIQLVSSIVSMGFPACAVGISSDKITIDPLYSGNPK